MFPRCLWADTWADIPQCVRRRPRFQPESLAADCLKAWERGLSPCDTTPDTYVIIRKSTRALAWCESGRLVKVFETGLGFSPDGDKKREGDGRTPIGTFYIPRRIPSSQFHRAFLISYPDVEDANLAMNAEASVNGNIVLSSKPSLNAESRSSTNLARRSHRDSWTRRKE